jgi:hypothetical protein
MGTQDAYQQRTIGGFRPGQMEAWLSQDPHWEAGGPPRPWERKKGKWRAASRQEERGVAAARADRVAGEAAMISVMDVAAAAEASMRAEVDAEQRVAAEAAVDNNVLQLGELLSSGRQHEEDTAELAAAGRRIAEEAEEAAARVALEAAAVSQRAIDAFAERRWEQQKAKACLVEGRLSFCTAMLVPYYPVPPYKRAWARLNDRTLV